MLNKLLAQLDSEFNTYYNNDIDTVTDNLLSKNKIDVTDIFYSTKNFKSI